MDRAQADAFYAAILEDPDDDATRLIFADWLEENDEPLGEFIRVQYALEETAAFDPTRVQLEERQKELLRDHRGEWQKAINECIPDGPPWPYPYYPPLRSVEFQRGFPYLVGISLIALTDHGESLCRRAPIQGLRVYDAWQEDDVDHLLQLFERPFLRQIRELDFQTHWHREGRMRAFVDCEYLTGLRKLHLPGYNWTNENFRQLLEAPFATTLEELTIDGLGHFEENEIPFGATFESGAFRALTRLALDSGRLPPEAAQALGRSALLEQLDSLTLANLGGIPFEDLVGSPTVTRLRHLDISGNRLRGGELGNLVRSFGWQTELRELHLHKNAIQGNDIHWIANAGCFDKLAVLNLRTNRLGDVGAETLAQTQGLSALAVLNLSYNKIGPTGAFALIGNLPGRVHTLDLSWNPVGTIAASQLARNDNFEGIVGLDLSYSELDDIGVAALVSSPSSKSLEQLNLCSNRISDAGLQVLADSENLENLKSLNLGHNQITEAGLNNLLEKPLFEQVKILNLSGNEIRPSRLAELRCDFRGILGG